MFLSHRYPPRLWYTWVIRGELTLRYTMYPIRDSNGIKATTEQLTNMCIFHSIHTISHVCVYLNCFFFSFSFHFVACSTVYGFTVLRPRFRLKQPIYLYVHMYGQYAHSRTMPSSMHTRTNGFPHLSACVVVVVLFFRCLLVNFSSLTHRNGSNCFFYVESVFRGSTIRLYCETYFDRWINRCSDLHQTNAHYQTVLRLTKFSWPVPWLRKWFLTATRIFPRLKFSVV